MALMELGDKLADKKYEKYVLKNMNFVFNEGNLEFFRKQYDEAFKQDGWNAVRKLSWHMIFRCLLYTSTSFSSSGDGESDRVQERMAARGYLPELTGMESASVNV